MAGGPGRNREVRAGPTQFFHTRTLSDTPEVIGGGGEIEVEWLYITPLTTNIIIFNSLGGVESWLSMVLQAGEQFFSEKQWYESLEIDTLIGFADTQLIVAFHELGA